MRQVHGALGSVWTIVVGVALVGVGAFAFYAGSHDAFGWFVYAEELTRTPILVRRFGTEALAGLALVGIGLLVLASAAGFRLGSRTGGASTSTVGDGLPG